MCANQPLIVVLKFREIDPTPNTVGSMGQDMELSTNGVPGVQFVHLHHLMSVSLVTACTITCTVGEAAEVIRIFDLVWLPLFSLLLPMKVLTVGSF